jgi:hypothetical protein
MIGAMAPQQAAAPPAWPQPQPAAQWPQQAPAAAPPGPFAAAGSQPMPSAAPAPAATPAPAPASSAAPVVKVQLPYGLKIPIKVGGAGFKFKLIGAIVFAIIAGVAVMIVKGKIKGSGDGTAKGNISYKSLGLDPRKVPVDEMISSVRPTATRWRKDAVFWSMNLQEVHADGTVDTKGGGNQVVFISLGGVSADIPRVREDSIKKFNFGPSGIDHSQIWGATDPWSDVYPLEKPTCGVAELMEKQLSKRGITGDKTVRISLDPDDYGVWHVWGDINAYFSPQDCSELKKQ